MLRALHDDGVMASPIPHAASSLTAYRRPRHSTTPPQRKRATDVTAIPISAAMAIGCESASLFEAQKRVLGELR